MIDSDGAEAVLESFRLAWRTPWDADMLSFWHKLLADQDPEAVLLATGEAIETQQFVPTPNLFLELVRKHEAVLMRNEIVANKTHSSFRCDGSRWRCARCKNTECDVHCEQDMGVEPCPSCNSAVRQMMSTPEGNKAYRNAEKLPENAVSFPACEPLRATVDPIVAPPGLAKLKNYEMDRWKRKLADSDWAVSRKDMQ